MVIADIGKQAKKKVYTEKQYKTKHIVPYREKQTCNIGKNRCNKQLHSFHNIKIQDI